MNKKYLIGIIFIVCIFIIGFCIVQKNKEEKNSNSIKATILSKENSKLVIQDDNNLIYTFNSNIEANVGENIVLKYSGVLDQTKEIQDASVISYKISTASKNEDGIPTSWLDDGIFSSYYIQAYNKLKTLSLNEKIGQLLLVRYPDKNAISALKKYHFGGFVFFEKDFSGLTKKQVQNRMEELQNTSNIPLLTAVDEEGGKVVRVSSNPNLVKERFKSPSELYKLGGFNEIAQDTIEKSRILYHLGLNLNLAPVVDVAASKDDYIYDRTLGENTELTSTYAKTVINASKGTNVSYTLKHFPGYGNNEDTHNGSVIDNRTYYNIEKYDLPPFKAGIDSGAEAILTSHNIVNYIDSSNPASLSPVVHNLLREKLGFTGITITDDLDMKAVSSIEDATIKAILAGNELVITTDYEKSFNSIKNGIEIGRISENHIDQLAFRILAWKYYKGLMFEK